ncbi:hypothetical protein GA0070616_2653 [Micromonospora nigra]|uniref:Uncharacterized protein n=2 Tax=Micromonospora nigra TaxID=145857 RepID=A0A1C6S0N8_9ACTN|nr:hypothetical protein GA0070616_2653 [Micromonospora nigra]
MVEQSAARRHHRSRIAYAFGILALLGAATVLTVVVRDPALSSTRLTAPVPAPAITVVGEDPSGTSGYEPEDAYPDDGPDPDEPYLFGAPDPAGTAPDDSAGADPYAQAGPPTHRDHSAAEISRSLFWTGVFGLAISLAGLGLVGTRRRMW